jgi:hypothetical protein
VYEKNELMKKAMNMTTSKSTELKYPATYAVKKACERLRFSKELVMWSIKEYDERNTTGHRDLKWLKESDDFQQLVKILHEDLRNIYCVFSKTRSKTDRDQLVIIIIMKIHKWFDTSLSEDDLVLWCPKAELQHIYIKIKEEKKRSSKSVVKVANIIEAKRNDEKAAPTRAALLPKKRVASTKESRGSERMTKRRETLMTENAGKATQEGQWKSGSDR